jgi:hypothetical protein
VDGDPEPCGTFTEAAQKLGLLESDDIYVKAMTDACIQESNLHSLRRYFANLLFHCTPSNPQKMFDDFLDELFPPPAVNDPNAQPMSIEYRRGKVLRELEFYFRCQGTNCRLDLIFLFITFNNLFKRPWIGRITIRL